MALTDSIDHGPRFPHGVASNENLQAGDLPESTKVLIVGGGPVGILSAIAVARYGLESVVLERHATRLGQPKAHVINQRSVEILRQYQLDLTSLKELGLSDEESRTVTFASSMNGIEYGVLETSVSDAQSKAASPKTMFNVAQPLLEEHLLRAALKTGKVKYLRSHEWEGCTTLEGEDEEEDHPVTFKQIRSTVNIHGVDGTSTQRSIITSEYLIACDGAHARSRDVLKIPFYPLNGGPEVVLHYASVHFSADLSHFRPGLLWFILNPAAIGIFIAYNRKNSWVFSVQYDPDIVPRATFTSEFMKEQVFKAVGTVVDDYKEIGITLWKTSPKIAESYRSPRVPRAFLAGDAAHSFPPTGGLGLNTGIADIQNLAWKINAVERGWTSDENLLFDTVSSERLAVAQDNSKQSKLNEENIHRLVRTIFRPGTTAEQLWADPKSRKDIQDAIERQRDHFHSLNLVLGYAYGPKGGGDQVRRGPSDYQKECVPGGRLPHEWVKRLKTDHAGDRDRVSTLDFVNGHEFVLFTSPGLTTEQKLDIRGVPVLVVQLGREFVDSVGEWTGMMGLRQTAAVLVRPDQHIVDSVTNMRGVAELLTGYLNPTKI
ncbi:hypothetical protein LTS17_009898 [Exophiala oligosperma]